MHTRKLESGRWPGFRFCVWALFVGISVAFAGCSGSSSSEDSIVGQNETIDPGDAQLTGVTISAPAELSLGESGPLIATAHFDDGSTELVSGSAQWVLSDPSLVDFLPGAPPLIIGLAAGSLTVQASYGGMDSNILDIEILDEVVTLDSIDLTADSLDIYVGHFSLATVTANYSNGNSSDVTSQVSWGVGNGSVITVSAGGPAEVEGLAEGSSDLTATFDGVVSNTLSFTVEIPPVVLNSLIVAASSTQVLLDETVDLVVIANYSDGSQTPVQADSWSVGDGSVIEVTNGLPATALGLAEGSTVVTATFDGQTSNSLQLVVVAELLVTDAEGWTEFTPTADTIIVYVSNSEGSNLNNGLSPSSPKQTLAAGAALLRDGHSDWLLLKRGDTWNTSFPNWTKGGISMAQPILVSEYGDPTLARPRVLSGDNEGFRISASNPPQYLAVVGIHFESDDSCFRIGPGHNDILIEDCYMGDSYRGVQIQNTPECERITIRRCVIVDNHIGIIARDTIDLRMEENIIDNNGVSLSHDHNIYMSENTVGTTVVDNILTRGSNLGLKFRGPHANGVIQGNLFSGNQNGLSSNVKYEGQANFNTVITDNVFVQTGHTGHHGAMYLGSTDQMLVERNLIANTTFTAGRAIKFEMGLYYQNNPTGSGWTPLTNAELRHNTMSGWQGHGVWFANEPGNGLLYDNVSIHSNILHMPDTGSAKYLIMHSEPFTGGASYANNVYDSVFDPSDWFDIVGNQMSLSTWSNQTGDSGSVAANAEFVDPGRHLGTYNVTLGGPDSLNAFLVQVRQQRKYYWRQDYTVGAAKDYVRAGFVPTANLGSPTPGAVPAGPAN